MIFTVRSLLVIGSLAVALAILPMASRGDDEPPQDDGIPLVAPSDWRGETISIPPGFAKDMKLTGVEKIRFAPGMFKPDAADFFSYVLVFRLQPEPALTSETLERELLAYYRGLALAVSRGKIKTADFALTLKRTNDDAPDSGATNYAATLKWIEPFATSKAQTLNMEIRIWKDEKKSENRVFLAVSPRAMDAPIWKEMRAIRVKFLAALEKP